MIVSELKEFYETNLGKFTCRRIRESISKFWQHPSKEKILGYGFALPYLPLFSYGNSCLAIMPPHIGAMKVEGGAACVMAEGTALPAQNEFFDRVIIIHGIENSELPEKLLEEMWRILKPSGKLLLIAPNEGSLWRKSSTPFRETRAYSKRKLLEYLSYNKFAPRRSRRALFFFPTRFIFLNRFIEFFGQVILREFCGIWIIEAEKMVFAPGGRPIKIAPTLWDRIFRPKPTLEGAS